MRRSPLAALALAIAFGAAAGRADEVVQATAVSAGDAEASAPVAEPLPLPADPDAQRDAEARDAAAREEDQRRPGIRPALPMMGLAIGGGFPEGAAASLVFRPLRSIRFFGGPTWGYYAWGMHGGVVLAPWNGWITPTLSFEGGQLFRTNLSSLAKGGDSGTSQAMRGTLARIDYRYVAGDLGLELGSPRGFAFILRIGLSFVTVKANGSATSTSGDGTRVTVTNPVVRATLPSLKLGLQYWF